MHVKQSPEVVVLIADGCLKRLGYSLSTFINICMVWLLWLWQLNLSQRTGGIISGCLCWGQKVALEHTLKARADGQLGWEELNLCTMMKNATSQVVTSVSVLHVLIPLNEQPMRVILDSTIGCFRQMLTNGRKPSARGVQALVVVSMEVLIVAHNG